MANTTNLDLVKPLGTDHALISVINGNMDKVDAYAGKVNDSLAGVQDGLAIVAVGDTHAAITSGQFVYVKEHNTLPEGLYTASTNIAANATLSGSNLTADSKGGLNALSDQIGTLNGKINFDNGLTPITDANNAPYGFSQADPSSTQNIPPNTGRLLILTFHIFTDYYKAQVAIADNGAGIYYRNYDFSFVSWNAWKSVTFVNT